MSNYQRVLPNQSEDIYVTDGGLETTLVFNEKMELPCFASFPLVESKEGQALLKKYYRQYADIATAYNSGFIFESPTWRANRDWGNELGFDVASLAQVNRDAIALMYSLRLEYGNPANFLVSGCIGPRGDGYVIGKKMSAHQADSYHRQQIDVLAQAGADLVTAMTMTYPEEAIGIVHAAKRANVPVVISFTTETDGKLPNGMSIEQAITLVDEATDNGPIYYAINCAHPSHFATSLKLEERWTQRIQGIRANASCMSHEELDSCEHLDEGDPIDFGVRHQQLFQTFSSLNVFGGCCGTSVNHIQQIAYSCRGSFGNPRMISDSQAPLVQGL